MKKVISIIFLMALLSAYPVFAGEMYTWIDENGSTHMTDYAPPQGSKIIDSRYVKPAEPPRPKTAVQIQATRELEEMEIRFRAQKRRGEKQQLELQLRLLAAQGQPINSYEAHKVLRAFAEKLEYEAMQRNGEERMTMLEECKEIYMDIARIGAVYEYGKKR